MVKATGNEVELVVAYFKSIPAFAWKDLGKPQKASVGMASVWVVI
jgi:hypothetical protein